MLDCSVCSSHYASIKYTKSIQFITFYGFQYLVTVYRDDQS